jgi:oligosaccharide repeat unit polymerase
VSLLYAFIGLAFLSLLNFAKYRDTFYPAFLQSILWASVVGLFVAMDDSFYPVSPEFASMIVIGAVMFSAGCSIATFGYKCLKLRLLPTGLGKRGWIVDLLLVTTAGGLPFYLNTAFTLGTSGQFDDLFVNLRHAVTEDIYSFGITAYFATLSLLLLACYLCIAGDAPRWKLWLAVGLACAYSMFTSGRTSLFFLILLVLGILGIQRRIKPVHAAIIFAAIALVAFSVIAVATLKGGNADASFQENLITLTDSFTGYLLSPMPAMTELVSFPPDIGYGENVFRFFFAFAERLGANVHAVPLIQPYTYVPVETNVYTVYEPYFLDFRWPGVLVAMFIFGAIHGHVYVRATSGDNYFVMVYGLLMYPLFMQFFQDQYFSLLSTWLQLALLIVFIREVSLRPELPQARPI